MGLFCDGCEMRCPVRQTKKESSVEPRRGQREATGPTGTTLCVVRMEETNMNRLWYYREFWYKILPLPRPSTASFFCSSYYQQYIKLHNQPSSHSSQQRCFIHSLPDNIFITVNTHSTKLPTLFDNLRTTCTSPRSPFSSPWPLLVSPPPLREPKSARPSFFPFRTTLNSKSLTAPLATLLLRLPRSSP